MEAILGIAAVVFPAGAVGLALAAISVRKLKRATNIYVERGAPRDVPGDARLLW